MNDIYEKAAGAKLNLNKNKTKIMIIGKIPSKEEIKKLKQKTEIEIEDPKKSTRILGIQVGGENSKSENEKVILKKARMKLSKIQGRVNTLKGRGIMVKNQLYAVVNYILQSSAIGKRTLEKIQNMVNVIMTGRRTEEEEPNIRARINRIWQRAGKEWRGLGIYRIEEQIRLMRIKMIVKLMQAWNKKEVNWTMPVVKLLEKTSQNLTKGLGMLYWRKEEILKWGKRETLPPVWMEAVGEWMNIKKRVQMTEVYEYPIISSEFEREGMRMTKNMERLIDMGMKKIKDLVIERSKEKIEEKIKRIGDRNNRNSLWKTYQKTKEKVEKRVQEEMKKPYGKTIESIEIWTNKGWRIARKITKTEKKKGAKAWKNKELRVRNMVPEKNRTSCKKI